MSGQIEPDVCSTELAESLSRLAMPAARDDVGLSNGKILTAGGGVCWHAFFRALEIRGLIHNQHLRIRYSMQPAAIIDEVVFHF